MKSSHEKALTDLKTICGECPMTAIPNQCCGESHLSQVEDYLAQGSNFGDLHTKGGDPVKAVLEIVDNLPYRTDYFYTLIGEGVKDAEGNDVSPHELDKKSTALFGLLHGTQIVTDKRSDCPMINRISRK